MALSSSERRFILLAHSYFLKHDQKQTQKMRPYAPLATLLAAAAVRERGYGVGVFDAMLADDVDQFTRALDETRPAVVALIEDNFNFLTKMCTLRMREAALDMVRTARSSGAAVVVNGSDASDHPELYLGAGADCVIAGDPEPPLLELIAAWTHERRADVSAIPGLIIPAPDNGGTRRTAPRSALDDLDRLPYPAWDLVDVEGYRRAWLSAHGRLSWSMATSRGCPYRCNWCAKPMFGTRYSQRTPSNVAQELRELKDTVAPDHIWFADDIFGLTPPWIEAFAEQVAARRASTPFTMQSRANLMTPRLVAALAEAGAEEVWLGVESGSQRVLDTMDKGIRVAQVRAATQALRAHGIRCCWFIQLGYLGEEWDDLVRTRDLIREEQPDDIGVSVAYPLPGTKFHDIVRESLGPRSNWVDSDELAMLFHGTYSTPFYRRVRDLLHGEVRGTMGQHRSNDNQDGAWEELARVEREFRTTPLQERISSMR